MCRDLRAGKCTVYAIESSLLGRLVYTGSLLALLGRLFRPVRSSNVVLPGGQRRIGEVWEAAAVLSLEAVKRLAH